MRDATPASSARPTCAVAWRLRHAGRPHATSHAACGSPLRTTVPRAQLRTTTIPVPGATAIVTRPQPGNPGLPQVLVVCKGFGVCPLLASEGRFLRLEPPLQLRDSACTPLSQRGLFDVRRVEDAVYDAHAGHVVLAHGTVLYALDDDNRVARIAGHDDESHLLIDGPAPRARFVAAQRLAADGRGLVYIRDRCTRSRNGFRLRVLHEASRREGGGSGVRAMSSVALGPEDEPGPTAMTYDSSRGALLFTCRGRAVLQLLPHGESAVLAGAGAEEVVAAQAAPPSSARAARRQSRLLHSYARGDGGSGDSSSSGGGGSGGGGGGADALVTAASSSSSSNDSVGGSSSGDGGRGSAAAATPRSSRDGRELDQMAAAAAAARASAILDVTPAEMMLTVTDSDDAQSPLSSASRDSFDTPADSAAASPTTPAAAAPEPAIPPAGAGSASLHSVPAGNAFVNIQAMAAAADASGDVFLLDGTGGSRTVLRVLRGEAVETLGTLVTGPRGATRGPRLAALPYGTLAVYGTTQHDLVLVQLER